MNNEELPNGDMIPCGCLTNATYSRGIGNYNLVGKLTIGFTTDAMYAEKDCPYCQGRGYVTKGKEFINSMQRWFDAHPGASSMIYD